MDADRRRSETLTVNGVQFAYILVRSRFSLRVRSWLLSAYICVQDLIDALRALGNNVRFTVLPGRDHGILDTYEDGELYSWFLEHVRSEKDNP